MTDTIRDAATGTERVVGGTSVRVPIPKSVKTHVADPVNLFTLRALTDACQGFSFTAGAGPESGALIDGVATFEVVAGVTAQSDIVTLIAGDADLADALLADGPDMSTLFDATFTSASGDLWTDVVASAAIQLILGAGGRFVPFSGKIDAAVHTNAFGAPPDSVLAVGTDDGTVSGAPTVQTVTTDGTAVQQADPTRLKMTEASAASILAKLDVATSTRASEATVATLATQATQASIQTAVEKVSTEVAVGDGLAVRQVTASKLNVTEASAAAIKTAVELIDDPVVVTDAVGSTKNMQAGLVAYADPSVLPADVSANGDSVPAAGSRKGETYVYLSRQINGEDASRLVLRTEQQPTASAELSADAIVVAAGTSGRVYGLLASVTVASVVYLRNDAVVGGSILKTFDLPVGFHSINLFGLPYGNGLYFDYSSGTLTAVVLYRNT